MKESKQKSSCHYFLIWSKNGILKSTLVPGMPGKISYEDKIYHQVLDRYLGEFWYLKDQDDKTVGFDYQYVELELTDPFFESQLAKANYVYFETKNNLPSRLAFLLNPIESWKSEGDHLNIGSVLYFDGRSDYILGIPEWDTLGIRNFHLEDKNCPNVIEWSHRLLL